MTVDLAGVCSGSGPCDTTPFGAGNNWVNKVGGLPLYIRAVAKAFRRKGLSESEAIQRAIGVVKNWAEGKGGVTPATRARAAAAVAEWERKKAQAHSLTASSALTIDLAESTHVYHWRHGWIPITPTAALSKAHGSHAGAAKLLHANGQHEDAHAMLRRGLAHHEAKGNVRAAAHYRKAVGDFGTLNATTTSEHFRMKGPELQSRAAAGDREAQAELDRRAARRTAAGGKVGGHRAGVPFRPAPSSPERPASAPQLPKQQPSSPPTLTPHVSDRMAQLERENRQIEAGLPGHTITSKELRDGPRPTALNPNARTQVIHTQHDAQGNRVGSVIETSTGGEYRASLNGSHIGNFPTRAGAHQALAREHDRATAEAKRKATETAARDARNAAANSKKAQAVATGLKGPGGHDWQSFPFESDGTRLGDKAAAKVKQSFRAGDSTVLIETQLSKDQTRALLSDITDSVGKTGVHGVTFRVPSGDGHFRSRSGVVGAYVRQGQRTVHINPKIATGEVAGQFKNSDNFMPANKATNGRTYTLVHELGHIVDHDHSHTSASGGYTPSGFGLPTVPRQEANALAREHSAELSKYGRTNNAEAYAEAYAQWIHGGAGSSKVADAYARRFGWRPPT